MKRFHLLACVLSLTALGAFAAPAQENWDNLCAKCHAADGTGSTKMGKKYKVKDYTDAKALESFSDEQLAAAILDGVSKDGKELMKGFKDEVSAEDAKALVEMIRKMAKK